MNGGEGRRRAVVIGVDTYKDETIPDLRGAANDATEMHELLANAGDFEILPAHFLLNEKATADNVRGAVSDLLWSTDGSDLALLYFSGHGLVDSYGNGYVAPHDMLRQRPLVFGLRMQELQELLLRATDNKKTILLMLDCCYSGIAAEGSKGDDETHPRQAVAECLKPLNTGGQGRLIFASSPKDEKSRERTTCQHRLRNQEPHEHGLFTFQMLEGLDGGAAVEDGNVTLESLIKFVEAGLATADELPPQLYGSAVNGLAAIHLGRAARQLDVQDKIAMVRERLGTERAIDLFRAIDRFDSLLSSAPWLAEADDLRAEIDARLSLIQGPAMDLLLVKRGEWSERCEETFDHLERLACSEMSCAVILAEEKRMRDLLSTLFEVCGGEKDEKILVSYLLRFGQGTLGPVGDMKVAAGGRR